MDTDRYICMTCHKGSDTPGFCPHCPQGELLDMTVDSERGLLAYGRQVTMRSRKVWLFFGSIVGLFIISAGFFWLLNTKMGWSDEASMLAMLASEGMLYALLVFWLARTPRASPTTEHTLSARALVASEKQHDEPVAGQPTSDVTDAPLPERQPVLY
ncbi:MAG: hypothetical protein P8R54_23340 [Myxococcota bacterium]|nr:hypothetical protein [Myxococcota bacterium]